MYIKDFSNLLYSYTWHRWEHWVWVQNVKLPYKYCVSTRLLLYAAVHPGIHHVCTDEHISSAPPSRAENIFTSYVTYLTATVIFTNNTIWMTSTHDVYLKEKMNPARQHQTKTRYVSEIFIVTFDLCHLQSMDKTEVLRKIVTKIKHKERPCNRICYTSPLFQSADHYRVTSKNRIR